MNHDDIERVARAAWEVIKAAGLDDEIEEFGEDILDAVRDLAGIRRRGPCGIAGCEGRGPERECAVVTDEVKAEHPEIFPEAGAITRRIDCPVHNVTRPGDHSVVPVPGEGRGE